MVGTYVSPHTQPLQLLSQLSKERLPTQVEGQSDVQLLMMLVMAGHAKATIPATVRTLAGEIQPPATMLAITWLGRESLLRFAP